MILKFENSSAEMALDKNFIMKIGAYNRRVNTQSRYGKDGAVATGDQMVNSRKITFSYQPVAEDDDTYLAILNDIIGFFNLSLSPFYLIDSETSRRCEIVLLSADDEAQAAGLERRIGKNRIEFEMLDGHWEDEDANFAYSETGGMASGENISIDNTGEVDCYPIIRIEPYETNTSFTIRNITTGAFFTLGSNSFVPGSEFIVDSQTGTIYLSVAGTLIELSSALASGSGFIKLPPGVNQIEYTSAYGEIDLEVEYRKRYAF
jgi:phage-related protein